MSTFNRRFPTIMKYGGAVSNRLMLIRLQSQQSHVIQVPIVDPKPHEYKGTVENYGPPLTYDYISIPFQPYKTVYAELQRKWNIWLAGSIAFFVFCCAVAHRCDVFQISNHRDPSSYRNRKQINAKLDAEEANASKEG